MKFRTNKAAFAAAVAAVRHAIGKGAVVDHVLIAVDGAAVRLVATNYELSILARIDDADCVTSGAWAVPGDALQKIVARIDDAAVVTIAGADGRVTMEFGRSRFELYSIDGGEFPEVAVTVDNAWLWPSTALLAALRHAHCPSQDDGRPAITGILLECDSDELAVVATDGYRVGLWRAPAAEFEAPRLSAIVHRQALGAIAAPADAAELVQVGMSGRNATFAAGLVTVQSRLVEAKFPDYRKILPSRDRQPHRLTLARAGLLAAVARVATMVERATAALPMRLEIEPLSDVLKLSATHSVFGTASTEIEIANWPMGIHVSLGVNPSYLTQALQALTDEHAILSFGDSMTPISVTGDNEPNAVQLIMPMKL